MSIENVEKFLNLVKSNENLQKELILINEKLQKEKGNEEKVITDNIVPLAKKNGIIFTADDFLKYADEQMSALSEEDLLNVSGGRSAQNTAAVLLVAFLGSLGLGAAVNLLNLSQEDNKSVVRKAEKNNGEDSRNNQDEVNSAAQNAIDKMSKSDQKTDVDEENNNENEAQSGENVAHNDNEASKINEAEQKSRRDVMQNKNVVLPNSNAKNAPAAPQINVAPQANAAKMLVKNNVPTGAVEPAEHAENVGGYESAVADSEKNTAKPAARQEKKATFAPEVEKETTTKKEQKEKFKKKAKKDAAVKQASKTIDKPAAKKNKVAKSVAKSTNEDTSKKIVTPTEESKESAKILYSGECGENAKWFFDSDGTFTVPGTGSLQEYGYDEEPFPDEIKYGVKRIRIENGITSLQNFFVFPHVVSIDIPASLTELSADYFKACNQLESINVNENNTEFKSIDGVLFSKDGTELLCYPGGKTDPSYTIPTGVNSIDKGAFFASRFLKNIIIPSSVSEIGESAFNGPGIKSIVYLGNNEPNFGEHAFTGTSTTIFVSNDYNGETFGGVAVTKVADLDAKLAELSNTGAVEAAEHAENVGGYIRDYATWNFWFWNNTVTSQAEHLVKFLNSLQRTADDIPDLNYVSEKTLSQLEKDIIHVAKQLRPDPNNEEEIILQGGINPVQKIDRENADMLLTLAKNILTSSRVTPALVLEAIKDNIPSSDKTRDLPDLLGPTEEERKIDLPDLDGSNAAFLSDALKTAIINLPDEQIHSDELSIGDERKLANLKRRLINSNDLSAQTAENSIEHVEAADQMEKTDFVDNVGGQEYNINEDWQGIIPKEGENGYNEFKDQTPMSYLKNKLPKAEDGLPDIGKIKAPDILEFYRQLINEVGRSIIIDKNDPDLVYCTDSELMDSLGLNDDDLKMTILPLYNKLNYDALEFLKSLPQKEDGSADLSKGDVKLVNKFLSAINLIGEQIVYDKEFGQYKFVGEELKKDRFSGIQVAKKTEYTKIFNLSQDDLKLLYATREALPAEQKVSFVKILNNSSKTEEDLPDLNKADPTIAMYLRLCVFSLGKQITQNSDGSYFVSDEARDRFNLTDDDIKTIKILGDRQAKIEKNYKIKQTAMGVAQGTVLGVGALTAGWAAVGAPTLAGVTLLGDGSIENAKKNANAIKEKVTSTVTEVAGKVKTAYKNRRNGSPQGDLDVSPYAEKWQEDWSSDNYVKRAKTNGDEIVKQELINPEDVPDVSPYAKKWQEDWSSDNYIRRVKTNGDEIVKPEFVNADNKDLSSYGKVLKSSGKNVGEAAKNVFNEGKKSLENWWNGEPTGDTTDLYYNFEELNAGPNATTPANAQHLDPLGKTPAKNSNGGSWFKGFFGESNSQTNAKPADNPALSQVNVGTASINSTPIVKPAPTPAPVPPAFGENNANTSTNNVGWISSKWNDFKNIFKRGEAPKSTVPRQTGYSIKNNAQGEIIPGDKAITKDSNIPSIPRLDAHPERALGKGAIQLPNASKSSEIIQPSTFDAKAGSVNNGAIQINTNTATNLDQKLTTSLNTGGMGAGTNAVTITPNSIDLTKTGAKNGGLTTKSSNPVLKTTVRTQKPTSTAVANENIPDSSANIEKLAKSTALVDPDGKPAVARTIKKIQPTKTPNMNRRLTDDEIGVTFLRDNGGIAEKTEGKNWASTSETSTNMPQSTANKRFKSYSPQTKENLNRANAKTIPQPGKATSTAVANVNIPDSSANIEKLAKTSALVDPDGKPAVARSIKKLQPTSTPDVNRRLTDDEIDVTFLRDNGGIAEKTEGKNWASTSETSTNMPQSTANKEFKSYSPQTQENLNRANAETITQPGKATSTAVANVNIPDSSANIEKLAKTSALVDPDGKPAVARSIKKLQPTSTPDVNRRLTDDEIDVTFLRDNGGIAEKTEGKNWASTSETSTNMPQSTANKEFKSYSPQTQENLNRANAETITQPGKATSTAVANIEPVANLGNAKSTAIANIEKNAKIGPSYYHDEDIQPATKSRWEKAKDWASSKFGSAKELYEKRGAERRSRLVKLTAAERERLDNKPPTLADKAQAAIKDLSKVHSRKGAEQYASKHPYATAGVGATLGTGIVAGAAVYGAKKAAKSPAQPGFSGDSSDSGYDDYSTGEGLPVNVKNLVDYLNKLPKIDINGTKLPDLTAVPEKNLINLKEYIFDAGENIYYDDEGIIKIVDETKFINVDKVTPEDLEMLRNLHLFLWFSTPKCLVDYFLNKDVDENGVPKLDSFSDFAKLGIAKIADRVEQNNNGEHKISEYVWDYTDDQLSDRYSSIASCKLSQDNIEKILATKRKYKLKVEDFIKKADDEAPASVDGEADVAMTAEEIHSFAEQLRDINLDEFWNRIYGGNGNILEEGREKHAKLKNFRLYCNIAKGAVTWGGNDVNEEDLKTFVNYGNKICIFAYTKEGYAVKCAILNETIEDFWNVCEKNIEVLKACVGELEEKIKEGFFDGFLTSFKEQAEKFLNDGKQLIANEEKKLAAKAAPASVAAAKSASESAAEGDGGEAAAQPEANETLVSLEEVNDFIDSAKGKRLPDDSGYNFDADKLIEKEEKFILKFCKANRIDTNSPDPMCYIKNDDGKKVQYTGKTKPGDSGKIGSCQIGNRKKMLRTRFLHLFANAHIKTVKEKYKPKISKKDV